MNSRPVPAVDIHGPVFISYRQSDGTRTAEDVARVLRAAGMPVWRDKNDLPPGDTEARLREAFAAGVSSAVLIVSPEIAYSTVVREVELPQLLELHRSSDFALQILNCVEGPDGKIDYDAPDMLLGRQPGDLKGIDQQPATDRGILDVAAVLAEVRVDRHRSAGRTVDAMALSVQTRNVGRAGDITDAPLDLRFEGGDERLPKRMALEDLRGSVAALPTLVTLGGVNAVDIEGGAHLSVAFAIGAALPFTRVSRMRVRQDVSNDWWGPIVGKSNPQERAGLNVKRRVGPNTSEGRSAIYIDLIENSDSDKAFEDFWQAHANEFASGLVVKPKNRSWLTAAEGTALAREAMHIIRDEWGSCGNGVIHLFLRVPFAMGVLMGHLSNTLEFVLYEWGANGYVRALQVKSGSGSGAVTNVLLEEPSS